MDWWLLYFLLSGGGEWWQYPLIGGVTVFTGVIAAMLGVGGGFLNVPIINYIANEPIDIAIGTSLFIIVFTSFSATIGYARKRVIDFKLGLVLETASIPGAFLGAYLTGWISESILKAIFGVALIVIGISMIFRNRRQIPCDSQKVPKEEKKSIKSGILNWKRVINVVDGESYEYYINVPLGLAFAFVAGVASGLLGIGGGIVKVPLLNVALGVPMIITVATSMFMIIFTSLTGTFEHSMLGQVNWMIGGVMIIGAIIGAQIGCRLALKISPGLLRKIFGAGAVVLAIQMIYEALISL